MYWYSFITGGLVGLGYYLGKWVKGREMRENLWVWACPEKGCGFSVKGSYKSGVLDLGSFHQKTSHPKSLNKWMTVEAKRIKE